MCMILLVVECSSWNVHGRMSALSPLATTWTATRTTDHTQPMGRGICTPSATFGQNCVSACSA